jgi:hypothetical protein
VALTAAERQRRAKKHRAGDHSLCDPARDCRAEALAADPSSSTPRFGPRGRELFEAMADVDMGPAHRVLLAEACRLADRLDRFERVLSGGRWFFERRDEDERVEIVIDNVLSEARQHASALKAIVTELEARPRAGVAAPSSRSGRAGVADLAARIQARRGANSAS